MKEIKRFSRGSLLWLLDNMTGANVADYVYSFYVCDMGAALLEPPTTARALLDGSKWDTLKEALARAVASGVGIESFEALPWRVQWEYAADAMTPEVVKGAAADLGITAAELQSRLDQAEGAFSSTQGDPARVRMMEDGTGFYLADDPATAAVADLAGRAKVIGGVHTPQAAEQAKAAGVETADLDYSAFAGMTPEGMGFEFETTFWVDFSMADPFGAEAVRDTYKRGLEFAQSTGRRAAEFSLTLNWKCWAHYEDDRDLSAAYAELWEAFNDWAYSHLEGEDMETYFELTD